MSTVPAFKDEDLDLGGTPTAEKMRGIFSGIAPRYDLLNRLTSLGSDVAWRRQAAQLAAPPVDGMVLDLAAGTADMSLELARLDKARLVVAADLVPAMLTLGREKAKDHRGRTRIEFQVADAQRLPFRDASFDVITVAFGVRNLPDRCANFREVRRVLRPGGRYVILEFSRPPLAPFRALYHLYLSTVVPFWGALVARDKEAYRYLNESIRRFPGQRALSEELVASGFQKVEWHDMSLGIVSTYVCVK